MTVWATSVIVFPEQPTATGGGSFTTKTLNGLLPVRQPLYAIYPWSTYGAESGGTIAGQGGSINVY